MGHRYGMFVSRRCYQSRGHKGSLYDYDYDYDNHEAPLILVGENRSTPNGPISRSAGASLQPIGRRTNIDRHQLVFSCCLGFNKGEFKSWSDQTGREICFSLDDSPNRIRYFVL